MNNLIKNKKVIFILSFIIYLININLLNAKNDQNKIQSLQNQFNSNIQNYNQKLTVINDNKIIAEFKIIIAKTEFQQSYGLMNITYLPQNLGMYFKRDYPEIINMWMKNTKIPLDMIFIDENYKIINIVDNTIPDSLTTITSIYPAIGVLEINGGLANKLKIRNGYKILLKK